MPSHKCNIFHWREGLFDGYSAKNECYGAVFVDGVNRVHRYEETQRKMKKFMKKTFQLFYDVTVELSLVFDAPQLLLIQSFTMFIPKD